MRLSGPGKVSKCRAGSRPALGTVIEWAARVGRRPGHSAFCGAVLAAVLPGFCCECDLREDNIVTLAGCCCAGSNRRRASNAASPPRGSQPGVHRARLHSAYCAVADARRPRARRSPRRWQATGHGASCGLDGESRRQYLLADIFSCGCDVTGARMPPAGHDSAPQRGGQCRVKTVGPAGQHSASQADPNARAERDCSPWSADSSTKSMTVLERQPCSACGRASRDGSTAVAAAGIGGRTRLTRDTHIGT